MSQTTHPDTVLIIDFGSQVTQLIARRVREAGVYCEIVPYNRAEDAGTRLAPKAIILSGGPATVTAAMSPRAPTWVFEAGLPILCICYGQQTTAVQLGGAVESGHAAEFGRADIEILAHSALFAGIWDVGKRYPVWMSHGDRVTRLPDGFTVKATSENAPFAIASDEQRRIYTTMFHPEVVHTPDGAKLIANFVHKVAGIASDWTMAHFKSAEIARIREQVGTRRVSRASRAASTAQSPSVLIHEAIGDQLTCIFVDHGLLRHEEADEVVRLFRESYNIPLVHVDARELFITALEGVSDPETKRKIIGGLFIDVFDAEAKKLSGAEFLAQGTLYPDVIESVSFSGGPSVTIKSHHNVGGLPARMNLKLVEPCANSSKTKSASSVVSWACPNTSSAATLSLAPAWRSASLAPSRAPNSTRSAKPTPSSSMKSAALGSMTPSGKPSPCCCPSSPSALWATRAPTKTFVPYAPVTSTDGMTADYFPFPHEILGRTATRIINEVRGINRVVYDVTSKPPGTIEWE